MPEWHQRAVGPSLSRIVSGPEAGRPVRPKFQSFPHMRNAFKIMFVHGVGFHEKEDALRQWTAEWCAAITASTHSQGLDFKFFPPLGEDSAPGEGGTKQGDPGILFYEDILAKAPPPDAGQYFAAVASLIKSYITTKVGDFFNRDRGLFNIPPDLEWKAQEIATWVTSDSLRKKLRQQVVREIRAKNPDIVIAHSYGSLITYDAFLLEDKDILEGRYLVTLGTQIGNPLLRNEYGGRQIPVNCRHWFNLYNPKDPVFVASLEHITAENFTQLSYDHGKGHDGAAYLGHPAAASQVWGVIADTELDSLSRAPRALTSRKPLPPVSRSPGKSSNRALLVGVDLYASREIPPLNGCVNDTFQLSAALQEANFDSRDIRILHNARATRVNLVEQLRWLLDDVQAGDHRFFSFSGHGHRMAAYGPDGGASELEEILCTHDYAFTTDSGLRDRDFMDLYAHLPPKAHFLIFLDCCHSGGITRAGGPAVRSFKGPSDVEHEYMAWDADIQMWKQQGLAGLKGLNEHFLPKAAQYKSRQAHARSRKTQEELDREYQLYYGKHGDTRRLGRATPLRDLPHGMYDTVTDKLAKIHGRDVSRGAYLPMIFMACAEDQTASEYLHGSISFGAYTYAMAQTLRDFRKGASACTYQELHYAAADKLRTLGYSQTPDILGPPEQLRAATPFGKGGGGRGGSSRKTK